MSLASPVYLVPFLCNCILVSSSILAPLGTENGLRILKKPSGEFEYVLKRHTMNGRVEDPDSKERRSSMGSSFIRFGRSEGEGLGEHGGAASEIDGTSKVNRYPRWKSPDIVIRFGRSEAKGVVGGRGYKRARSDLNFIRFGRNMQIYPLELDLTTVCSELTSIDGNSSRDEHPQIARLLRLCNTLNNLDEEQRHDFDFLEEQTGPKRE